MRLLTLIVALLLVLIQYPLWLGKGGWLRTWDLERQLDVQRHANDELRTRNAALDAEVRDLKSGTDAIEERARYELGMLREGEAFVQIVDNVPGAASGAAGTQVTVGAGVSTSGAKPGAAAPRPAAPKPAPAH